MATCSSFLAILYWLWNSLDRDQLLLRWPCLLAWRQTSEHSSVSEIHQKLDIHFLNTERCKMKVLHGFCIFSTIYVVFSTAFPTSTIFSISISRTFPYSIFWMSNPQFSWYVLSRPTLHLENDRVMVTVSIFLAYHWKSSDPISRLQKVLAPPVFARRA